MRDSNMPEQTSACGHPVVVFDGVCNLCNGSVRWIIARDPSAKFKFAALQSAAALELLAAHGVLEPPESSVLIDSAGVHMRSDGVIRLAKHLGFPWSLAIVARIIPRIIRDAIYVWIARNRYRWFGRRDRCMVPTPALKARFLDSAMPNQQGSTGDAD